MRNGEILFATGDQIFVLDSLSLEVKQMIAQKLPIGTVITQVTPFYDSKSNSSMFLFGQTKDLDDGVLAYTIEKRIRRPSNTAKLAHFMQKNSKDKSTHPAPTQACHFQTIPDFTGPIFNQC
jgi:hypothetical protein